MAKQLNVNLAFTADTSQAAAQVRNLQTQLTNLINQPVGIGTKMTAEIQSAVSAAAELKVHLQNATNIKTGTLDFGRLNQSLKASGTSLSQYAAKLQSIGPQGQQAFMSLARSVANAEVPLRRSNALLTQFGTTLANTARWQLSSSLLHGFISSVSSAWRYSQNLNESLNNIRIVTGKNIDEMAKFADQANKAAKALSATTTEYTNASLIYYQQGLSDTEVLGRAATTIKMANASRQSAEIVADQMTAIWNNFYDGSRSLEYYADVVTALGAATASSSEEIATGLEKFAAVAETVGLSYEYATSALATITATTRQSADIVGTALKTLFARLSDLKLGETLEDGTTLGQYSENLAKIGVNIKDASGQLKDMDTILNETAAKWDTLDRAQQTALAKGVAGIRQYTQFIALMDNWDFMEKNLATASGSSGTLQRQADTYAESWEAARDRVTASLEVIYESIMDDEFFIDLTDGFADLIDGVGRFIKSIGGLQGVLSGLGFIFTRVFATQMAEGFRNLAYNIQMSSDAGVQAVQLAKKAQMEQLSSMMVNSETSGVYDNAMKQVYSEELQMQTQLVANAERLSAEDQKILQIHLQAKQVQSQQTLELAKQVESAQNLAASLNIELLGHGLNKFGAGSENFATLTSELNRLGGAAAQIGQVDIMLDELGGSAIITEENIRALENALTGTGAKTPEVLTLTQGLKGLEGNSAAASQAISGIKVALSAAIQSQTDYLASLLGVDQGTKEYEELRAKVQEYLTTTRSATVTNKQLTNSLNNGSNSVQNFSNNVKNAKAVTDDWAMSLTNAMSGLMSAGMLLSSINGLMDTLQDPDTSGWEKFGSILTSVSMIALSLMGVFKGIKGLISVTKTLFAQETIVKIANKVATNAQTDAERKLNLEKEVGSRHTRRSIKETVADTKRKMRAKGQNIRTSWNQGAWDRTDKKTRGIYTKQSMSDLGYTTDGKGNYFLNGQAVDGKTAEAAIGTNAKSLAGKGALKHVGKVVTGAAIAVITIAAAAAIIKTASDHYNRFDIAATKAREAAAALNETYETVKSTESEFRTNIGEYTDAVDGLEKLTKGTEEYEEAVRKANDEALELIKTHKNLKYTINSEGLIEIDEASLLAAQRESLARENRAAAAALAAQQDAATARVEANKVNFARTQMKSGTASWDSDDTNLAIGGAAAGGTLLGGGALLTTAAVANFWNPVGWALMIAGGVIAALGIGTSLFNNDAQQSELDTMDALVAASMSEGGRNLSPDEIKLIADAKDSTGELSNSLLKDVDATNKMIAEIRENTEAINRNNDLIASQLLADDAYMTGSDHYDAIVDHVGDIYGNAYKKYLESDMVKRWGKDGIAQIDGANAAAKRVWAEYLEYAGLQDRGWELVDTKGDDENRIFVYLDEQGQRQEKTLNEMQKMYAAYLANNEAATAASDLVAYYTEWASKEGNADQAIASFLLNKNFTKATQREKDAMYNELNGEDYNGDITKYLQAKLGPDLEAEAKRLGYTNAEALITAFQESLTKINKSWKDISIPGLDENITQNIKLSSAQVIENLVRDMNLGKAGEQGGQDFINGLNTILANMSPEDWEIAMQKISEIDWSQWDAGTQVKEILEELGYSLNMSEEDFENWVMQVNTATGAMFDYAASIKKVNDLNKLTEGITIGDIITNEEYLLLVSFNQELEKYFRLLGDGTAQLVGDPLEFLKAAQAAMKKQKENAVNSMDISLGEAEHRFAKMEEFEKKGWNKEQLTGNAWNDKIDNGVYRQVKNQIDGWDVLGGLVNYAQMTAGHPGTFVSGDLNAALPPADAKKLIYDNDWVNGAYTGGEKFFGFENKMQTIAGYHWEKEYNPGVEREDLYNQQKQFLIDIVGMSAEEVTKQFGADAKSATKEQVNNLQTAVSGYLEDWSTYTQEELEKIKDQVFAAEIDYALSADSVEERQRMYESGDIHEDAYLAAQQQAITQEAWENLDVEAVQDYAEYLEDAYNLGQEQAEELARSTTKMNKGLDELISNWETWGDMLKKSSKSSQEYQEAIQHVKHSLSDILDVSEDFISNDFIALHLDKITKAAEGNEDAIDALALALAQDIFDQTIKINLDGDTEAISDAQTLMEQLTSILSTQLPQLKVGQIVNEPELLAQMNSIVEATKMTVEQANAWYRAMGFVPEFDTATEVVENTVPITTTEHKREYKAWQNGQPTHWIDTETSHTEQVSAGEAIAQFPTVAAKTLDGKLSTEYKKPSTKVKSLTYVGGGSMSNYSSVNLGGSTGGGGGGSEKKDKSKEKERYHDIKTSLDKLSKSYDAVSKARGRAFGADKLKLLEQERAILESELETQRQYLSEIESYYNKDRSALEAYGATFAEDGTLLNYDALMDEYIEKFNTGKIDEDAYTAFKEAISQYEETWNLLIDEKAKEQEKANELYDLDLEEIKIKLELDIGLIEDQLEWIEYQLENIEDAAYDAAEAFALLSQKATEIKDKSDKTSASIAEFLAKKGITDINDESQWANANLTEDEINQLREWRNELFNANKELLNLKEQAIEQAIAAFDEWNAKIDENIEKFDHYDSVLNSYKNIIDLVGKDALGISDQTLAALSEAEVKNATNKLAAAKIKLEQSKKAEAETLAKMAGLDPESEEYKILEKTLKHIQKETAAAEEEMMSSWEDALQAAADAFEEAVDRSISTFEKAMAGTYGSLEELQKAFEQSNEVSERYVEDYKKIYELSKLNRDITNSIDETDNVKAKQALRDLQKEINDLQNSNTKMSQYDLDHARKKYELRLAEIALEEAKNSKSTVRMRRDSEGNYSYVFTADQDKIDDAQQKYEDALYEMQELNSQYIKEMQNNILQSEIELAEALRQLDRTKFASDEDYYKKLNELTEYYTGKRNYYLEEANKGIENNQTLVNEDWANYSAVTGYKMSADEDYVDKFSETTYAQLAGYKTIQEAQDRFAQATQTMVNDLKVAFSKWQTDMSLVMSTAGTSVEGFEETVNNAVYGDGENEGIISASDAAVDAVTNIATAMDELFTNETLSNLASFAQNYATAIAPMITANNELALSLNEFIAAQAAMTGDTGENVTETDDASNSDPNPEPPAPEPPAPEPPAPEPPAPEPPAPEPPSSTSMVGEKMQLLEGHRVFTKPDRFFEQTPITLRTDIPYTIINEARNPQGFDLEGNGILDDLYLVENEFGHQYWVTKQHFKKFEPKTVSVPEEEEPEIVEIIIPKKSFNQARLFDTGGYTGDWGSSEGRLAMLHSKELVLNAKDTENLLATIELVRNIAHIIDLNAGVQSIGLGQLNASNALNTPQTLEQQVTIHAEFPEAQDRNEIKEAFSMLINEASQFANRKNL